MTSATTITNEEKAEIVIVWVIFLLVMKNVILLILLATLRRRAHIYRVPEDVEKFHGEQYVNETDDWSLSARINRCLRNDTEYVPYFLALSIILLWTWERTPIEPFLVYNHIFPRALVYGIIMVIGRYLHNLCYIFKITYGRIIGFLLTVVVLTAMSIDVCYYVSKRRHNIE
jgi:uncharacterized membrane protein YecN with MAPEG domain